LSVRFRAPLPIAHRVGQAETRRCQTIPFEQVKQARKIAVASGTPLGKINPRAAQVIPAIGPQK
jgi:hypothetical protein